MGAALHKFTCIKMLTMILWILAFLLFNVNVVVGTDGFCGKNDAGDTDYAACTTGAKDHCKITKASASAAIVIVMKTENDFKSDTEWKEGYTEGYQYKTGANDGVICYLPCLITKGYEIKNSNTGAIPTTTRSSDHTTGADPSGANPSGANPSGAPRSMMNAIFIAVPLFNVYLSSFKIRFP